MPEISVIIPACDAGRTIAAALASVAAQTFRDREIIVVDGSSTDDTADQVTATAGAQYIGCRQRSVSHARNIGITHATGRWIAFLDAADVWLPRKLQRQMAFVQRFPDIGLVKGASLVSATPLAALGETDDTSIDQNEETPRRMFAEILHAVRPICTSTVLVRRDVLAEIGAFDEHLGDDASAWELWLRVAARHAIGETSGALAIRKQPRSESHVIAQSFRDRAAVVERVVLQAAGACTVHGADGGACVRETRFQLAVQLGDAHVRNGHLAAAAAAYNEARRLRPSRLQPYLRLTTSAVGSWLVDRSVPERNAWLAAAERLSRAKSQPSNLIHDTAYRRARTAFVRQVHAMDDIVSCIGRSRVRVLFEAATPMSLAIVRPILGRLQQDPRLEVWFTTSDRWWHARRLFEAAGITNRIVPARDVRWMKVDAYVNTDFWNMTWLPRRTRRIHLFHGVAGKYSLDAPVEIAPVVASFDRLMFPNRERLLKYARAGLIDPEGPEAALVGYPKLDCLVDGSLDGDGIRSVIGLDPSLPTVLYAPTWSPYSSLHSMGLDIIAALSRLDVNVIVKLHDRSYDRTARGSGGIDWRERLEHLARRRHVHIARDFDATPYLFVADLTITDHSSVGFEFMLLDRPIVVIDSPLLVRKAQIARDKVRMLHGASAVVTAADQVGGVVMRELADPARLSASRRAVASELFYCPGGATRRAVQCFYDALSLLPSPEVNDRPAAVRFTPAMLPTDKLSASRHV